MPRLSREESISRYYHVMTRGINKYKIFMLKADKDRLLNIIREKTREVDCKVYAYCIMDNHLHILVECDVDELSILMKKINISYAMYYNYRNNRMGPVFQDRFKSEIIYDERQFYAVIRYIHNNPVKANITTTPEKYIWNSMGEYINKEGDIIHRDAIKTINEYFNMKLSFVEFHRIDDKEMFLEIEEEIELSKEKLSEQIIASYLEEAQLKELSGLEHKREVISKLLDTKMFSYRKIAEIVDCSINMVYDTNKKNRP